MSIIGIVFMTGSSLFVTVNQSMQEGFRNSITGDFAIKTHSREPMSLFGATIPGISEFFHIPRLKYQNELEMLLDETSAVEKWTPLISGNAVLDIEQFREGVPFFGVDFSDYLDFFPELEIVEKLDGATQNGLYISEKFLHYIQQNSKKELGLGDQLKLSTLGETGFKIRLFTISGIYRYPFENPVIDRVLLLEQNQARALVSVLASQIRDSSPEESSDLLDMDFDSYFTENSIEEQNSEDHKEDILSSLENFLMEEPSEPQDDGSWQFILIRINDKIPYSRAGRILAKKIHPFDLDVLTWRQAAGQNASYAYLLQIFFYSGFLLILISGIIGIMNMMLISLFDRFSEIGTMQALGADSRFIFKLLSLEYFILTLSALFFSLLFCFIFFQYMNSKQISFDNMLLLLIFGGKPLTFPFSLPLAFSTLLVSLFSGSISALFPIHQALALEPVDALKGRA